ncbi:ribokinase [Anaerotaenia torta]|uniref:ribokinase n=1 Tax=Anaerotaenia torta TaxID=433293 RepID=UPI003D1C7B1D
MRILNFGSLNLDHVYSVDHFVNPGETISSHKLEIHCGGKGLNHSIALAKAGLTVHHAGKIGSDGRSLLEFLEDYGVNTDHIQISKLRTGCAIIQVDKNGQNAILLYGGANHDMDESLIRSVIGGFDKGDYLLLQNEINHLGLIMEQAHKIGMKIIFNPSPADDLLKELPLEYVSLFLINEIEGEIISGYQEPEAILEEIRRRYPESGVLLTMGEKGAYYQDGEGTWRCNSFKAEAVDTTAAGDTFTGYFLAGLLNNLPMEQTLRQASMAASIAVSRAGAAVSIPYRREVLKRLSEEAL